jgi:hypothetical protein
LNCKTSSFSIRQLKNKTGLQLQQSSQESETKIDTEELYCQEQSCAQEQTTATQAGRTTCERDQDQPRNEHEQTLRDLVWETLCAQLRSQRPVASESWERLNGTETTTIINLRQEDPSEEN